MSVVVLVRACPALPETVTSGTPAAICIVIFVCRSECTVLVGKPAASQILCTQLSIVGLKITTANKKRQLKITWKQQPQADGYQVYRSTTGKSGSYKKIATLRSADKNNYTDTGLKAAKTYYYAVRAFKKVNDKAILGKFAKINLSTRLTINFLQKKMTKANRLNIGWIAHGQEAYDAYDWTDTKPIPGEDSEWLKYVRVKSNKYKSVSALKKAASSCYLKSLYSETIDSIYVDIDGKLYRKNYDVGGEGGEGANEDGALHTDNQHITESASPDGEGKDFAQTADYKEDTLHTKKSRAGFSVPLAGVRSLSSLGCGDLGCLKLLADLACELGEGTVHALQVVDSVAGRAGTPIYPVLADIRSLESVSPAGKQAGYLASAAELEGEDTIDFAKVYNAKMHYLNERFQQEGGQVLSSDAYHSFWRANRHWLEQYSAYCVLRHKYGTGDSRYWSEPDYERLLEDDSFIREYSADMRFHLYVQFILHNQLQEALAYAAGRGIAIEFSARQEALPQTMRQWWAGLGQEERQSWCKDKLGLDIQPPQQLEGWLAESVLEERLKDKPGAKDIPLEDLLGITRILPWPAAEAGPQANVRMPVRLEDILQHKALLEQIRKVADSSIRKF